MTILAQKFAGSTVADAMQQARAAQPDWAALPLAARLARLKAMRRIIARDAEAIARSVPRPVVETLATELVPLADACRFLERAAPKLLAPRKLGRRGRPLWLFGVDAEIRREPFGVVLIIAPGNYPLFLPGVQLVQALAAGNAAALKPSPLGGAAAEALHRAAVEAGVDPRLCPVLPATQAAGEAALAAGPDKVVLTGSAETGKRVLAALATRLTPSAMELSGNDPVFVLDGADVELVAASLRFGLRLNGSATCIAPRRVFASRALHDALAERLATRWEGAPDPRLHDLAEDARSGGARVVSEWPLVVAEANPGLRLLNEDIFAPALALMPVEGEAAMLEAAALCPFALGASVFGPEDRARALAGKVRAGAVTVNDLIVPTGDPRLPFGGRGRSGFGVTRGAEGLLELTTVKTISVRRGRLRPHLDTPAPGDAALFGSFLRLVHGGRDRGGALLSLLRSACSRARRGG